jgi:hypothetical protein
MSLDGEKLSLDEKNSLSRGYSRTPREPIAPETAQRSEMLLEQDRATLMALFEWLTSGREGDEISNYVTLLSRTRR